MCALILDRKRFGTVAPRCREGRLLGTARTREAEASCDPYAGSAPPGLNQQKQKRGSRPRAFDAPWSAEGRPMNRSLTPAPVSPLSASGSRAVQGLAGVGSHLSSVRLLKD